MSENRRVEDWAPLKLVKYAWPALLALVSIVAMWTTMSNKIVAIDTTMIDRGATIGRQESRLVTLETKFTNLEKQLDSIDGKLDKIISKVR
jgi:peptidoglycan hydrolase CwlO-like protein